MQKCGALRPRPSSRPIGWECDGTNLVTLAIVDKFGEAGDPIAHQGVPLVVHRDLVWWASKATEIAYEAGPFAGGDHIHLMIPPLDQVDKFAERFRSASADLAEAMQNACPGPHTLFAHGPDFRLWCKACGRSGTGERIAEPQPSGESA